MQSLNKRQASAEQPVTEQAWKLAELEKSAVARLGIDLAEEAMRSELAETAYMLVHANVLKQNFIGGCIRDYGDCPRNWVAVDGNCVPPIDYVGFCGPIELQKLAAIQIEEFSWRCKAAFPCVSSCVKDFSACPEQWVDAGAGLCLAPLEYEGICSPATDFNALSASQKASWGSQCGVDWYSLFMCDCFFLQRCLIIAGRARATDPKARLKRGRIMAPSNANALRSGALGACHDGLWLVWPALAVRLLDVQQEHLSALSAYVLLGVALRSVILYRASKKWLFFNCYFR